MIKTLSMTFVTLLLGFMVALRFGSTDNTKPRDTRDIYQLQEDLTKAQKQHINLNKQLTKADDLLQKYQNNNAASKVGTMEAALKEQQELAGKTSKTGKGVIVTVNNLVEGYLNEEDEGLTADLLRRLINEMNLLGATDIAISDERITSITPIRQVHNQVYVNDSPLTELPFKISVLTSDVDDFKKHFEVSESVEEFARNGLNVSMKTKKQLTLPAYKEQLTTKYMNPLKGDE